MRDGPGVTSVDRCLSVIEAVASAGKPVGVSALARQLDLPKATVHRICRSLTDNGFAAQDDRTRRYHAGWRLYGLAARTLTGAHLPRVIDTAMRQLGERTGGHAFFGQLSPDGRHLVVVAERASRGLPQIDSCLGWVFPADRAPVGLTHLRNGPASRPEHIAGKPARRRLIDYPLAEEDSVAGQTQPDADGMCQVHRDFPGPGLHCAPSVVHDEAGRSCGSLGVIFAEPLHGASQPDSPGLLCARLADTVSRSLVCVPV